VTTAAPFPAGGAWVSEEQLEDLLSLPPAPAAPAPAPGPFRPSTVALADLGGARLSPPVAAALRRIASHPALHGGAPPPPPPPPIEVLSPFLLSCGRAPPWPLAPALPPPRWPLFTPACHWVPHVFPRRRGWHLATAFHGTSTAAAGAIVSGGFKRAACRRLPACAGGNCDDQMLGFGVYLGAAQKARTFAYRHAAVDAATGAQAGAVVTAVVDMGHVKAAAGACPCGMAHCGGKEASDHLGAYYAREGFDAVVAGGNGAAAASATPEWAVADPARVAPVGAESVSVERRA
jgi:hypothetical protein